MVVVARVYNTIAVLAKYFNHLVSEVEKYREYIGTSEGSTIAGELDDLRSIRNAIAKGVDRTAEGLI